MNFIVMRREDMVFGVDCFAMAGIPAVGVGGMLSEHTRSAGGGQCNKVRNVSGPWISIRSSLPVSFSAGRSCQCCRLKSSPGQVLAEQKTLDATKKIEGAKQSGIAKLSTCAQTSLPHSTTPENQPAPPCSSEAPAREATPAIGSNLD
jgi:hypothetical protein